MNTSARRRDFTEGPLFSKMLLFSLPLIATSILQVLYNAADKLVVGQFSGDPNALAAIGSVGSLNAFFIQLLVGIGGGAGVMISQYIGAGRTGELKRVVSTALCFSLIGGIAFMAVAYVILPLAVSLISTAELYDKALLYTMITNAGLPALAIYNFGSAILRGKGDSRTPLYIGTAAGIMNVGLNLVFVTCFKMSVDGVSLATVISQYFSAVAVVIVLVRSRSDESGCFLDTSSLRIEGSYLLRMLRLGIPSGLQSSVVVFANMLTAGTFNHAFSTEVISANAVAGSIDIVVYTCMGCISQAVMTFVGQNYGAKKPSRIRRVLVLGLVQSVTIGVVIGFFLRLFGVELANLFVDPDDPMRDTILLLIKENWFGFVSWFYFIHGISGVLSGFVRGLGYSITPSIAALVGEVGVKVAWALFIFPIFVTSIKWYHTGHISGWLANLILTLIITIVALFRLRRLDEGERDNARDAEASVAD